MSARSRASAGDAVARRMAELAWVRLIEPRFDGCAWDDTSRRIIMPIDTYGPVHTPSSTT